MISSVRFPHSIEVTSGDARSTWRPGEHGVTRIAREGATLVFETNKAGVRVTVWPPPGTVVVEEDSSGAPVLKSPVAMEMEKEVPHGPASSEPGADPPRARPIKPRR